MEAVKEKPTIKSRTQSEINIVRQEAWLTVDELSKYVNMPIKEVESLLNDGYFQPSRGLAEADKLISIESVKKYLFDGARARPSDALFQVKQRERKELQERINTMKTSLASKVGQMNEQLRIAKITFEGNKLDVLGNEENIGFAHSELNKLSQKLGI